MAAYVIYQGEVHDAERYQAYKAKAAPNIRGRWWSNLVRGGEVEPLEGDSPSGRTVILEFPTMKAAIAWYRSEEYTAIRKLREGVARANIYVVNGID